MCSCLYDTGWEWVAVGGIIKTGAFGATKEVPDTVAYSIPDMTYPSIPCLTPPKVVVEAATLV